ncbi:hypothetical protein M758_4G110100 [Ceratodon purpureus]|nr:hypothetical protein M758_4G110100 [Ceratodon purpureus]
MFFHPARRQGISVTKSLSITADVFAYSAQIRLPFQPYRKNIHKTNPKFATISSTAKFHNKKKYPTEYRPKLGFSDAFRQKNNTKNLKTIKRFVSIQVGSTTSLGNST